MSHENSGVTLTPKVSFILGLAGGILILCTVGFFILLGIVMNGSLGRDSSQPLNNLNSAPSANVPTEENKIGKIIPVSKDDHVQGPDDAKVTLIEYSDFECPYCSKFVPTMEQVMKDYTGKVRWVYRHFPLSFHENARPAANAAECAAEQGKFWEYATKLYENQSLLSSNYYEQLAGDLGLNKTKFKNCITSAKYDNRISADMAGGTEAGIQGTPGTIIIGQTGEPQLVPGAIPYEQLKSMIEAALK